MGVLFLFVVVGLVSGNTMFENIVFQKLNDITTTRSRWLVTFVIDLDPYQSFINTCRGDIGKVALVIRQLVDKVIMHRVSEKASGNSHSKIESMFLKLDQEVISLNTSINSLEENFLEYQHLSRPKRSLLPFVGKALNFLFGTVSEEDLGSIKNNVQKLAKNQARLAHVVQEGLTILNVSRVQISENRQEINKIVSSLHRIDKNIFNVTVQLSMRIDNLEWAVKTYLELELVVEELRQTVQTLVSYLEHLHLQLNMLSLGHMSPSTITPSHLLAILQDVKIHLPPRFKLAGDPEKELWEFYRTLTCTTVLYDRKILIIVPLPLLDLDGHFEIYQAHNLPIPMLLNDMASKPNSLNNMVTRYKLETNLVAVDTKRTKYVLLQASERHCTEPLTGYCNIQSPVYPINFSKLCVIALFVKNEDKIKKSCRTEVWPRAILPMAEYLAAGQWAIATKDKLDFTIVCEKGVGQSHTLSVHPPLDVIQLNDSCSASNDYLTLLPYYHNESNYHIKDNFLKLIHSLNVSKMILLEPIRKRLANFTFTKLPEQLKTIDNIPMDHLIDQLLTMDTTVESKEKSYVGYFIALGLIIILVISIIGYCKFVKPWLAKRIRRGGHTHVAPDIELVPVESGGEDSTHRQRLASAPFLSGGGIDGAEEPLGTTSAVRHLYPGLDLNRRGQQ